MIITGKTYDVLKWIAQIVLPAVGAFYVTLAALWGLPSPQEVAGTILAVDTLLGVVLGISQLGFGAQVAKGTLDTVKHPDGSLTYSLNLDDDPASLHNKKRAVFDVVSGNEGITLIESLLVLCIIGMVIVLAL